MSEQFFWDEWSEVCRAVVATRLNRPAAGSGIPLVQAAPLLGLSTDTDPHSVTEALINVLLEKLAPLYLSTHPDEIPAQGDAERPATSLVWAILNNVLAQALDIMTAGPPRPPPDKSGSHEADDEDQG